jgi:hypothetical protein
MRSGFTGFWGTTRRVDLALLLGLVLALLATGSASAEPGTPDQKRACTPDVYRLCAGEIPNVRAITACLRRQKASLSDACRAVFEQWMNVRRRAEIATASGNAACLTAQQQILGFLTDFGSPGWIRTSDHSINSRMLYRWATEEQSETKFAPGSV